MSKRTFRGARVLLTGASSGIGRELALELRGAAQLMRSSAPRAAAPLVGEMNAVRAKLPPRPNISASLGSFASDVRSKRSRRRSAGSRARCSYHRGGGRDARRRNCRRPGLRTVRLEFLFALELTKTALPELTSAAAREQDARVRPLSLIFSIAVRGTPILRSTGRLKPRCSS